MKHSSARRRGRGLGAVILRALVATLAFATASAESTWAMPSGDAAGGHGDGVYGHPLESGDLPTGVLTIKVVGRDMSDGKVGVAVRLYHVAGRIEELHATTRTGNDGRARFDKLRAGERYRAAIEGARAAASKSRVVTMPAAGGVRMALRDPHAKGPHAGHDRTQDPHGGHAHGSGGRGTDANDQSGAASVALVSELAADRVRVVVLDAAGGKPLANTGVELARGQATVAARTGADGRAELSVPAAAAKDYTVTVRHDGVSYDSAAERVLDADSKLGRQLTFRVYGRSTDLSLLALGQGTHLLARVGAQAVGFLQVLALTNSSGKVLDPGPGGLRLRLPRGATGVQLSPDEQRFARLSEARDAVVITRPIAPGALSLRISYDLPIDRGTLVFEQRFPVALGPSILAITNSPLARATGPSVSERLRTQMGGSDGRMAFFKLLPHSVGQRLELTLFDLPYHDTRPTYVVLGGAVLIVFWAIFAILGASRSTRQLDLRREQLLDQLARLTHQHERGELADEPFGRQREPLLAELRRVWG